MAFRDIATQTVAAKESEAQALPTSVRISFGIQPRSQLDPVAFWRLAIQRIPRSHYVRRYHDHKSRSRRV
jgi:hypothetical protein